MRLELRYITDGRGSEPSVTTYTLRCQLSAVSHKALQNTGRGHKKDETGDRADGIYLEPTGRPERNQQEKTQSQLSPVTCQLSAIDYHCLGLVVGFGNLLQTFSCNLRKNIFLLAFCI